MTARRRDPIFWFAALVLVALVLASVLGELVPGISDGESTVGGRFEPPSLEHPLGTDGLGRSLLARLLEGIRTTFLMSVIAVLVTSVLAITLGIVAAYRGRWIREIVLRLGDVLYAFPAILLALLIAAAYGPGWPAAIASIVLVTLPLMTRMVTAAAAQVMRRDFVTSARISGVRAPRSWCGTCLRTCRAPSSCKRPTRSVSRSSSRAGYRSSAMACSCPHHRSVFS